MDKNLKKIFKLFKIDTTENLARFTGAKIIKAFPIIEQNIQTIIIESNDYVYELDELCRISAEKHYIDQHSRYKFRFVIVQSNQINIAELLRRAVIQTYHYVYKVPLRPKSTMFGYDKGFNVVNIVCGRPHQHDNLFKLTERLNLIINVWFKINVVIKIFAKTQPLCYLSGFIEEDIKDLKQKTVETVANHANSVKNARTNPQQGTTDNSYQLKPQKPEILLSQDSIKTFNNHNLKHENDHVTIIAQVVSLDERNIQTRVARKHLYILNLIVTDNYIDSLRCNLFATDTKMISSAQEIKKNDWIQLKGKKKFNKFYDQFILNFTSFTILDLSNQQIFHELLQVKDTEKSKRIELHCHTKMSAFNGINDAEECLQYAVHGFGHQVLAITDSNNCQSFIKAYNATVKLKDLGYSIHLIYGVDFSLLPTDNLVVILNNNPTSSLQSVISVDLETTGLYPKFHEIIEIGSHEIINGKLVSENNYQEYIAIKNKIPAHISALTHITDAKLQRDGKPEEETIRHFAALIQGKTLIAHNGSFDNSFLQKYFRKYNVLTKYSLIDTLDLARILYPGKKSYRLEKLAKLLNVEYCLEEAHSASYDAKVLGLVWIKMYRELTKQYPEVQSLQQLEKVVREKLEQHKNELNIVNYHQSDNLLCLARTQEGIFDLYRAVTNSAKKFFHTQEMIPILEFKKKSKNILLVSPGVNSKLTTDILQGLEQTQIIANLASYHAVEINPPSCYNHLLAEDKLTLSQVHKIINLKIKYAKLAKKPFYGSGNVFYLHKNQKQARDVMINAKQIKGRRHKLFSYKNPNRDNPDQHYRSTAELTAEFSFLTDKKTLNDLIIDNACKIAKKIKDNLYPVTPGLHKPVRKNSPQMLEENTFLRAKQIFGDKLPLVVRSRIETELKTIKNSGYDIIYWTCHKLTAQAAADHSIVGSRGSVGSSIVAFLNNITNVNPLFPYYLCRKCHDYAQAEVGYLDCGYDLPKKNCPKCKIEYSKDGFNIPFETFLGINGEKVPDIDLNFDPDYQNTAHEYLYNFFGRDNCFRAGTISTIKSNLAYGYVKNYEEETQNSLSNEQISLLCALCEGIKRTCGQHPGGIIVVPITNNIHQFTPVNPPANDQTSNYLTTHYPFDSLHHNLLKFDILGHDDPRVIKFLADLTKKDLSEIEFVDEKIIKMFQTSNILDAEGELLLPRVSTLGIPEFGTKFVIDLLTEIQPKNISDLVRISGLAHGTNVWKNNFQSIMPKHKLAFNKIICCRDDIMIFLKRFGIGDADAFAIMEDVRKGNKLTQKFLSLMDSHNVPGWFVEACLKISYIFPKAHASAYVISAWTIAWFKYYEPLAFYSAIFSIKCSIYDYEMMLWSAIKLQKYINGIEARSRQNIPAKEKNLLTTLRLVVEFKQRGYDFLPTNIHLSAPKQFVIHTEDKKLLMPFCVINGLGSEISQKIVRERDKKPFVDYNDLKQRARINKSYQKYFEQNF